MQFKKELASRHALT